MRKCRCNCGKAKAVGESKECTQMNPSNGCSYVAKSNSKFLLTINVILYSAPSAVYKSDENKGKVLALYKFSPQYAVGITMYTMRTYPTETLTMAKKGHIRGLNKKEAIAVQSRVKAPIPRPFRPDPIWWAVTDLGKANRSMRCFVRIETSTQGTSTSRNYKQVLSQRTSLVIHHAPDHLLLFHAMP